MSEGLSVRIAEAFPQSGNPGPQGQAPPNSRPVPQALVPWMTLASKEPLFLEPPTGRTTLQLTGQKN